MNKIITAKNNMVKNISDLKKLKNISTLNNPSFQLFTYFIKPKILSKSSYEEY